MEMVPPEVAPLMEEKFGGVVRWLACRRLDGDFVQGGAVDIGERGARCFGEDCCGGVSFCGEESVVVVVSVVSRSKSGRH